MNEIIEMLKKAKCEDDCLGDAVVWMLVNGMTEQSWGDLAKIAQWIHDTDSVGITALIEAIKENSEECVTNEELVKRLY